MRNIYHHHHQQQQQQQHQPHQKQTNTFNSLSNNGNNHYQQQDSNQFINNFTNKSYQHNLSFNNTSNNDSYNQSNDHQKQNHQQYQTQSPKQLIKQFNQMNNVTSNLNNKFKPLAQMSHLNSPTASPNLSASSHQNLNYYTNHNPNLSTKQNYDSNSFLVSTTNSSSSSSSSPVSSSSSSSSSSASFTTNALPDEYRYQQQRIIPSKQHKLSSASTISSSSSISFLTNNNNNSIINVMNENSQNQQNDNEDTNNSIGNYDEDNDNTIIHENQHIQYHNQTSPSAKQPTYSTSRSSSSCSSFASLGTNALEAHNLRINNSNPPIQHRGSSLQIRNNILQHQRNHQDKFQNSQQQLQLQQAQVQQQQFKKQSNSYHNSIMSESSSVMIATSPTHSPNHLFTNNQINSPKSLTTSINNSNKSESPITKLSDQNNEQNYTNSRFFDSSTLYKKELKQKQRDIISSTSSLSFANAISTTITNESSYNPQAKFMQSTLEEEHEEDCSTQQQQHHPQPVSTSNKMLNLFSNFLSRHNNHSKTTLSTQSNDSNHSNYLNIKNLKRATSSTNFDGSIKNKVSSPPTFTSESSSSSINKLLFNPAALFSMNNLSNKHKNAENSSKQYQHQQQANLPSNLSFIKTNNKYRRSYDDVSKLSILITDSVSSEQQQQPNKKQNNITSPKSTAFPFANKNSSKSQFTPSQEQPLSLASENTENIFIDLSSNSKFENTAFSTKNNGLIFLPSPTKCRTPSPSEQQQMSPQTHQNYNDNYELIENVNNARNINKINYDSLLENETDLIGTSTNNIINKPNNSSLRKIEPKSIPSGSSVSLSSLASLNSNQNGQNRPVQLNVIDLSSNINNCVPTSCSKQVANNYYQSSASFSSSSSSCSTSSSSNVNSSSSNVNNQLKPSDEILKRLNTLTLSSSVSPSLNYSKKNNIETNDTSSSSPKMSNENAFENAVYSYVDNIRNHSKRLSETNLSNQGQNNLLCSNNAISNSKPPMPSGVFVVSMTTTNKQPQVSSPNNFDGEITPINTNFSKKSSPCSSFSSNSSSSSKSSSSAGLASPSISSPSSQLAAAASAVQLTLNSSTTNTTIGSNYMEPKNSKWNKSQSINGNLNTLSPSMDGSSRITNSSFKTLISPNSISSSETVIIKNNNNTNNINNKPKKSIEIDVSHESSSNFTTEANNDPNKNVIHMRNKFEKFSSQPNCLNKPQTALNNCIQNSDASSKVKILPIIFQSNQTSNSNSNHELVISTASLESSTSSLSSGTNLNNQNHNQVLVSPSPSIESSSASSPSSSSSSFDPSETIVTRNNFSTESKLSTSSPLSLDFNFYNEFYSNLNLESKSNEEFLIYQETIRYLITNYFSNNVCVKYLLNPQGHILSNERNQSEISNDYTQIDTFKFTIDYFKTIMASSINAKINLKSKKLENSKRLFEDLTKLKNNKHEDIEKCFNLVGLNIPLENSENTDSICVNITNNSNHNRSLDCSIVFLMLNVEFDVNCSNLLNSTISGTEAGNFMSSTSSISSNSYEKDSGISSTSLMSVNSNNNLNLDDFDFVRKKLTYLLARKLDYLNEQMKENLNIIESNNKLGNKILKLLEQNSNVTSIELDKYKLLVNESDVIINLLLKLCHKIANTENSIQLLNLFKSHCSLSFSEELDLFKQDLNQIQRKKEEAIFLKNGIDKRALIVNKFLQSYLNTEQLEEFEHFMKMKYVNPLQLRHTKDHIELTQLQIKILGKLNLSVADQSLVEQKQKEASLCCSSTSSLSAES